VALTPKQQRFVDEYLVDLNATQAAIRAGYSPKTAKQAGHEALTKPDVQAAVSAAQEKRSQRTGITADVVLGELLRLARVDIGEAFDESGNLLPVRDMPEDVRRAIAGIDVAEEGPRLRMNEDGTVDEPPVTTVRKVRFWDKRGALELLGKHLGLFVQRVEHTGKDGAPIQVISGVPASPES